MAELKQFEPNVDFDLFSLTKLICNKTIAQTGDGFLVRFTVAPSSQIYCMYRHQGISIRSKMHFSFLHKN
jgi:hypothetical protein